jgi:DNA-directed RNA polymerase specialized sigma24 family protein
MDESDFAALALPLLRALYNLAHWLTPDPHEAEELVQEAYTRALKGFSGFWPGTSFRVDVFVSKTSR